jgi:hypothetical protein
VWQWFIDVFNPGGVGMGPYRTEFREIEAFARVTNQIIRGHEALMIRKLAELYMRVDYERQTKEADKDKPTKNGVPPGTKNVTTMKDAAGVAAIFRGAGSDRPRSKKSSEPREQIPPRG